MRDFSVLAHLPDISQILGSGISGFDIEGVSSHSRLNNHFRFLAVWVKGNGLWIREWLLLCRLMVYYFQVQANEIKCHANISLWRYAGEFYDGDRRTPVFKWCSSPIASEEAVLLLIRPCEENLVATATPRNIAHNCVFVVNLDRLPHQEDVKCDNLGSWRNNGIKNRTYEMNEDGYPELLDEEEASRAATSTYTLRRVYYKNKAAPDLKKYILSLKGTVTWALFELKQCAFAVEVSPYSCPADVWRGNYHTDSSEA